MTKKDIQQQLQECLEGYDGGLSPEECLSAYPDARAELEPLFRQAISLRVAFAAAPSQEFKLRAREKLLFNAGRDVQRALASEPDPAFVQNTRRRLLNLAGAEAQEALRDVPPPRLPFWMNARRHLLETASAAPPKPAPAMAVSLRSALSAAVVVLAVAVAGAGFLLQDSPANQPQRSASTDIQLLQERITTAEQQRQSGETFSTSLLDELATLTTKLAEEYNTDPAVLAMLPDLIDRQKELAETTPFDETVALAQQRLAEADQRVTAAAEEVEEEETPEPTATSSVAAVTAPTEAPTEEPTPEASSTPDIPEIAIVSPNDVAPGQVVTQYDASVTGLDLRWWRVTTSTMTFAMPEAWQITNLAEEDGIFVLQSSNIIVQTDVAGLLLLVSPETGEVTTAVDGEVVILRTADGSVIDANDLAEIIGPQANWASIYNTIITIELVGATPGATETPTQTPSATPTVTPTETPSPTATPEDEEQP